jgi:hypothetical protein
MAMFKLFQFIFQTLKFHKNVFRFNRQKVAFSVAK